MSHVPSPSCFRSDVLFDRRHERRRPCYHPPVHREWLGLPVWFVFGLIGAWIATSKGRGGCFWFLLCSLLGPIGLLIAAVSPRVR